MADDHDLVARLQAGDETAFASLVDEYHAAMVRLAASYVPSRAVAEEVVQDTWLGVVRGIDRFEGRSSLKTWLFHILVNRARSTGARERRMVPTDREPTVGAERFGPGGHWAEPPTAWSDDVDDRLAAAGLADHVRAAIEALPEGQRRVVLLRDVEGLSAGEACTILGVTEGNQRVLLHRGRAHVRGVLEQLMGEA